MWLISQRANAPPPALPPRCKIHFPPNRRLKRSLSLLRILYLQSGCNGMIKFSFSFSFFFLLAPLFFLPPSPNNHPSKTTRERLVECISSIERIEEGEAPPTRKESRGEGGRKEMLSVFQDPLVSLFVDPFTSTRLRPW